MASPVKPDWFLGGMFVAIVLAWAVPGPGAHGGWLHPEALAKAGVAVVFFLHGVGLSSGALRAGVLNWRLHALVQTVTSLVFPLIGFGLSAALDGHVVPELRLGIFYLCALPSTVSSSVALTAAARGNVAGAVFNATLSSLIGTFRRAVTQCRSGRSYSIWCAGSSCRSRSARDCTRGSARGPNGTRQGSASSIAARFCCSCTRRFVSRSNRASGGAPALGRWGSWRSCAQPCLRW